MDFEYWKALFVEWQPRWKAVVAALGVLVGLGMVKDGAFGYEKNSDFANQPYVTDSCTTARAKQGSIPNGKIVADAFCEDATGSDRVIRLIFGLGWLGGGAAMIRARRREFDAGRAAVPS